MATNYKSTVGTLAEEVADLLRHDNIDARIYSWIGMTYGEVLQRFPLEFFQELVTETFVAGEESKAFTTPDTVGTPMALVMKTSTHSLYSPKYVSPQDYSRITVDSTEADADIPRVWTIMQNATPADALFIWPGCVGASVAYLFHVAPGLTAVPTGADYLPNIPYHFEDVIVWGAAALGASMLRTPAYPIYQGEYEEALFAMSSILGYKPDSTPVMRSITGEHAGSMMAGGGGGRFPETIS